MSTEENKSPPSQQQTPASATPPANQPAQTPEQIAAAAAKTSETSSASSGSTDLGAGTETTEQKPAAEAGAGATDLGADPEETNPDGTPKAKEPVKNEYHGFPETGDFEITVPDGFQADPALKESFAPIAKELDLSPKGVQKLVDYKAGLDKAAVQRWGDHLVELKTQAKADPEIGGAKYDPAVAAGRGVIGKYGTPAFRKMLNDYGVGAHPEMIRFMSKVAKATGETPVLDGGAGSGVVNKPLHELLYKD